MKKLTMSVMAAVIIAAFSNLAQAELDIPASGTFDIVIDPCDPCSSGISFDPTPYSGSGVYLWPFASDDGSYTSPYSDYNIIRGRFFSGSLDVDPCGIEQEGDLGIRFDNISGATQTLTPSVLTLDFAGGSFDVYLPGFTFDNWESMFFWIAESKATYYANSSKDVGFPDMSASEAMAVEGQYLARTPEPATVMLFGLGVLLLGRRRQAGSR